MTAECLLLVLVEVDKLASLKCQWVGDRRALNVVAGFHDGPVSSEDLALSSHHLQNRCLLLALKLELEVSDLYDQSKLVFEWELD